MLRSLVGSEMCIRDRDPATGTGTFLAEVVRQVHTKFEGQEGMWPQYVEPVSYTHLTLATIYSV